MFGKGGKKPDPNQLVEGSTIANTRLPIILLRQFIDSNGKGYFLLTVANCFGIIDDKFAPRDVGSFLRSTDTLA